MHLPNMDKEAELISDSIDCSRLFLEHRAEYQLPCDDCQTHELTKPEMTGVMEKDDFTLVFYTRSQGHGILTGSTDGWTCLLWVWCGWNCSNEWCGAVGRRFDLPVCFTRQASIVCLFPVIFLFPLAYLYFTSNNTAPS